MSSQTMKRSDPEIDIDAVMQDDHILEEACQQAVRNALIDHKRTGDPIVVWENGQVVWIPADRIQDDGTIR
ncbi:MAG: hypothetical protein IT450_04615 [Phycisphaerales bacterium]|nr:hypothetical protein [Phycisphaerales bacterium]